MAISVGDKIPNATIKVLTPDGPADVSTDEVFGGKKVVLVGLPGAFTGTCHNTHVPGFVKNAGAFKAKGVSDVHVLSVNDFFVMGAWEKSLEAQGKVGFIADGLADFTKALGMDIDLSAPGLGVRSKRFAMVVEDGTVKSIALEENPGEVTATGAEEVLKTL